MKVIDQLYDGISTTQKDEVTADQCASLSSTHPDYNILAGRIIVSNHQKNTMTSFTQVISVLYQFKDPIQNIQYRELSAIDETKNNFRKLTSW